MTIITNLLFHQWRDLNIFFKLIFIPNETCLCWPDIQINAESVELWIGDDPFETTIGDNLNLMRDENIQREMRKFMAEKRLKKENLYKKQEKDAMDKITKKLETFNQAEFLRRAKELNLEDSKTQNSNHQKTPKKLFSWTIEKLNLTGLSDSDFFSVEKCLKQIREIDDVAIQPPENVHWLTLWFRCTELKADSMAWKIRDYELPMFKFLNVNLSGRAGMGEIKGGPHNMRKALVKIAENEEIVINRNMIQLKTYLDMVLICDEMQISWSPTYDPAVSQIAYAIDMITPNNIDPSPALSWWDKVRLILHGRLKIHAKTASYHSTVDMIDPNCTNERLVFQFNDFLMNWTPGKYSIDTKDTRILIKSIRCEESQVAFFPKLRITTDVEYELNCQGYHVYDHHNVKPVNPESVAEWNNWDTFETFRSTHVNLDIQKSYIKL